MKDGEILMLGQMVAPAMHVCNGNASKARRQLLLPKSSRVSITPIMEADVAVEKMVRFFLPSFFQLHQ